MIMMGYVSCQKKGDKNNCKGVYVVQHGTPCSLWGITIDGNFYPSANIPDEFKVDSMHVCASYELYDDMRLCVCCGGTWANIKSMEKFTQ
jgi:hypothetical protein